ncbi:hypothetical protein INT45_002043 [Circinella minor]|uniref:Uncharacterized protein n=1 Tax=Circinella minor TaxID=1195481 RepID=A0A8H7SFV2_9FUNG|nr:hypothetical protein INT45_002043 [Circinella minor]
MTSISASDDEMKCTFENCSSFGKQFTKKGLRNHQYQQHNKSYSFHYSDSEGSTKCISIDRVNDVLTCDVCEKTYKNADAFRKHVFSTTCNIMSETVLLERDDSDDASISADDDTVHVALDTMATSPSMEEKEEEKNTRHDYKTAILSAFNALDKIDEDKEKKSLIAQLGELEPVAYVDNKGKEHNLLAASEVIQDVVASQEEEQAPSFFIVPKKRKKPMEDDPSEIFLPSIRNIILDSQYRRILAKSSYVEVDRDIALWLNYSWTLKPRMVEVCARLLEEMIITENSKALLILGGELYSRLPSLDAHYEKTISVNKGNIPQSSLPSIDTKYENIEVKLMDNDNAKKLVLGTKTMNALFTSSIRLDNSEQPIIGASSANGFIPSKETRIFVEKHKLQEVKTLMQETTPSTNKQQLLYSFDEFSQLRQVRSKFDRPSTFLCYRFTSKYTNDIRMRPLTIWTLADRSRNQDRDSDATTASKLFKHIASHVWKDDVEASLDRSIVARLRRQCKPEGKIEQLFANIEKIYTKENSSKIIGNKDLDRELKKLAALLSSEIADGNKQIAANIHYIFNQT